MTRFRGPAPETVVSAPLDTLVALYHRPSGTTHLVEPLVPELLAALGPHWTDPATLLDRLSAEFEMPDADLGVLAARLHELAALGLVEHG